MADLIETLTSLQEAIFLGTVAGVNQTQHCDTGTWDFLSGPGTSGTAIFPGMVQRPAATNQDRTPYRTSRRRKPTIPRTSAERHAMPDHLDVIVLDDDPQMCSLIAETLEGFYAWGSVYSFSDFNEALAFCKNKEVGVAIFLLDVYLGKRTAFDFLDRISDECAWAAEDTVIITGNASDDIVNMCTASNITYLLEKPVRVHAMKLAVQAIVGKYLRIARRIREDSAYAGSAA